MTAPQDQPPFVDVRMRGFRDRAQVDAVLQLLDARTAALLGEVVPLLDAAGRVLSAPVVAAAAVPGFVRAAMDGFAVRAADTVGADASHPVPLAVVGEALPARPFAGEVGPGQAVRIMTGAPVPTGADAVMMAEVAREEPGGRVLACEIVSPGRHVGRVGEDVPEGQTVLPAGRKLRPQDVGLIASVGVGTVSVVRRPRAAILVTGDELLLPGSLPEGYRIVDSNSPMLAALVGRDGGVCLPVRYLPDRYEAVRDAIREADAEVVLVSGGTSVGKEDHAPRAVAELGELAVHGIAMRPAGPLGVGFLGPAPPGAGPGFPRVVLLLPGNPVSCLCAYDLFAGRVVRRVGGRSGDLPYRRVTLPLAAGVTSAVGRVDYLRVRVTTGTVEPTAVGGASILSTTVTADGFVLVGSDRGELAPGESVDVWLYD
ncbi:MAG: moeA 2 [Gemmataceae bacterium]|nr:moeA 2 [Gemmataceae bacterium]